MILVAAVPAEVHWVESLLGITWQELLSVYGHGAPAGSLERGVSVPGTGDELVQFEGEKAARARLG
jgi:hypothetical protein